MGFGHPRTCAPDGFRTSKARPCRGCRSGTKGRVNGEEKGATIVVTDTVAASGKRSLAFHDAQGIDHSWKPIWETRLPDRQILGGKVRLVFDVMIDKDNPGQFAGILRHYGRYEKGNNVRGITQLNILPNNTLRVGRKTLKMTNGGWHHVELSFIQGTPGRRNVEGSVTAPDGSKQTFRTPCDSQDYVGLNWIGFSAMGDSDGLFTVDNLVVELVPLP